MAESRSTARPASRDPTLLFWRWLSGFLGLLVMMLLGALGVVTSHLVNEAELAKDLERLEERLEDVQDDISGIDEERFDRRIGVIEAWIDEQRNIRRREPGK